MTRRYIIPTNLDDLGIHHGTDKASTFHDYLRIYGTLIPYHQPVNLLEIGWGDGASMRMWREYLHIESTIVGVDINEPKEQIPGVYDVVVDATSPAVQAEVEHHGPFDFIIDDGSHLSPDVIASFQLLWPLVKPGGLYIIEDLHVSYHRDWKGHPNPDVPGPGRGRTSMQFLRRLADDVHYGHAGAGPDTFTVAVQSIAFHPGLAIIEKRADA